MRTELANNRAAKRPRAPPSASMNPEYVSLATVDTLRRKQSCAPVEAPVRTFLPWPTRKHQAEFSRGRKGCKLRTTPNRTIDRRLLDA